VRQGNQAFAQRDWPASLTHYEAAPGDTARNAGVHMNRGLARFRIALPPGDGGALPEFMADAAVPENWQRAQDEIRNTSRGYTGVAAEDIESVLRAQASYNLANTYFAQHLWQSAIDTYKESLRLRPGWVEAAWNLDLARRRKEDEDHPDAGPDAGRDASQDGPPPDGSPDGSSGDGGSQGDGGRSQPDGGSSQGDGGSQQPDAASPQQPDGGNGEQPDAGAPPPQGRPDAGAPPPMSLAPLDQLERNAQDLQQLLLRQRAMQNPRSIDDER
jgi:tetratricopeptide (TPR) repeat protein